MLFAASRYSSREAVDEKRFGRLVVLLQGIQLEIEKESTQLHPFGNAMTDCAAFSLEAMENGDNPEIMSAKIDTLTRSLIFDHRRQVSLDQQMSFLNRMRAELQRILPSNRA
ncbi:hypothetical protein [Mesorhizobium erdmanii]|uniref:hypothetical protein n=1 Tax=Mesorhizobium erdmanii TaxID=1777866 RepID=UPI0012B5E934|nr:hypothetical protein [Mesorhizobium erdmanii]